MTLLILWLLVGYISCLAYAYFFNRNITVAHLIFSIFGCWMGLAMTIAVLMIYIIEEGLPFPNAWNKVVWPKEKND